MKKCYKNSICVVGAGVSGLACANKLAENGFSNITILEASNLLGGRIRRYAKDNKFSDFDIELGAEEIHGENSEYFKLINKHGGKFFDYWGVNNSYIKYNNEFDDIEILSKKEENTSLKNVWDMFCMIDDILIQEASTKLNLEDFPDISFRKYLKSKNISEDAYFLANAVFAIESATDLDNLSVKGVVNLYNNWKAGESNYFLSNLSHYDIITRAYNQVISCIAYNSPVRKIEYTENSIKVNENLEFDYCVITVPVSQISKIEYIPNLPDKINDAIQKLKLDSCAKIILKFEKSFWPDDSSCIYLPGLINIFWPTAQGKDSKLSILTGMTSGENCRNLNKLYKKDKNEFIYKVIKDIEDGFLIKEGEVKKLLIDYIWFDWTDVEYIEGGYTYAVINEDNLRSTLRESVDNNHRLYFAGEATADFGHHATIHGAIESGLRAAEQILEKTRYD